MDTALLQDRKYTEQEYFDLLTASDRKLEFDNGTITMMAGGKRAHNKINRNTFFAANTQKKQCHLYMSDTAIFIPQYNRYYFPDFSAVCEKEEVTDEGGIERLLNPSLLVEVLSKSTSQQDRGKKFEAYKTLPSFREYVMIDSREMLVTSYYKAEKGLWRIGSYFNLDQEVEFTTLGISIPMSVIYDGVEFEK